MRALLACFLALTACTASTEGSPPRSFGNSSDASTDDGCGGKASYTTSHTAAGTGAPCTVLHYCSGGVWRENGDDCHFKSKGPMTSASCPTTLPGEGTPCSGTLACSFACATGTASAACVANTWRTLHGCGQPPTIGQPCTDTATCDPDGTGLFVCSTRAFGGDTLSPTPVCIGVGCEEHSKFCSGEGGVCTGADSDFCVPRCSFDDSGAAPTGCAGKNACLVASTTGGAGVCYGGCVVDADCPAPERCLVDFGLCVSTLPTVTTKAIGEACTGADFASRACACALLNTSAGKSYCSRVCRVGREPCPSGYACDPLLATTYTKLPDGLVGQCLKACVSDADCSVLGAKCAQHGGMTTKTCVPVP